MQNIALYTMLAVGFNLNLGAVAERVSMTPLLLSPLLAMALAGATRLEIVGLSAARGFFLHVYLPLNDRLIRVTTSSHSRSSLAG